MGSTVLEPTVADHLCSKLVRTTHAKRPPVRTLRFAILLTLLSILLSGTPLAQAQGSGILNDNFGEDGALNPSYWTTSSAFLTALAAAASSPAGSFVAPELAFHPSGMKMTAPTQDYEMTGIQSIDTFGAPLNTQISVTPTAGRDDSFEILLASPDLTQFLTVSGNVGSANKGIWATAPNISELSQLGEQFSPPIETAFNTDYKILIDIDAQGAATVTVKNINAVLGTLSNLQAGVGPFYLVLGQRTGLARTGPQVAKWHTVRMDGTE
jgi:hypothetical protein